MINNNLLNSRQYVNNILTEEMRIEYEIVGFEQEEKETKYNPFYPSEYEIDFYFLDKNNNRVCEVPNKLVEYLDLHNKAIEEIKNG